MQSLADLRELIKDDLLCILDGLDDDTKDQVCRTVVERVNEFAVLNKTEIGE